MLHNFISPDITVKTAALVAGGASNILNRTNMVMEKWKIGKALSQISKLKKLGIYPA